jgi:transketolase
LRNTFISTLTEVARADPNVWLVCGDLGFSVLEPFATEFPNRFVNAGVAEQNMAGLATGIALSGKTVFIYSIGNFPTLRCLEQIRNDVCYHGASVKVVSVGAGFAYGSQGYTHHAIEDVAVMSTLPGMEVWSPADPQEVAAITRDIGTRGGAAYLRLSRAGEPTLGHMNPDDVARPRLLRSGDDTILLATGPIAALCLDAAELLARDGYEVAVASVARLKPFPGEAVLDLTRGKQAIVTVEEHILRGGLYAAVLEMLAATPWNRRVVGLGIPEPAGKISLAGTREELLAEAGLSAPKIAQQVAALCGDARGQEASDAATLAAARRS